LEDVGEAVKEGVEVKEMDFEGDLEREALQDGGIDFEGDFVGLPGACVSVAGLVEHDFDGFVVLDADLDAVEVLYGETDGLGGTQPLQSPGINLKEGTLFQISINQSKSLHLERWHPHALLGELLRLGLIEIDGDTDFVTETDPESETVVDIEFDGDVEAGWDFDTLIEPLCELLPDGDKDFVVEPEAEWEIEGDPLGDACRESDALAVVEIEGVRELDTLCEPLAETDIVAVLDTDGETVRVAEGVDEREVLGVTEGKTGHVWMFISAIALAKSLI
jgi:hypothetical protein